MESTCNMDRLSTKTRVKTIESEFDSDRDVSSVWVTPNEEDTDECLTKDKLPPKPLQGYTRRHKVLFVLGITVFVIVLPLMAFGLAAIVHDSIGSMEVPDFMTAITDCEIQTASTAQRFFYVNVWVAYNISFTEAKLCDASWDTFAGQGGRMLHGWILYHLTARFMTRIMEYSALPFHFQLNLLFSTASFPSIWSTARLMASKQPIRTTLSAVWLLFAISYVMAFPVIWGATTGYMSPSVAAYRMPDGTVAPRDYDAYHLCWDIQDRRWERVAGPMSNIVIGPSLYRAGYKYRGNYWADNDYKSLWPGALSLTAKEEAYANIMACKGALPILACVFTTVADHPRYPDAKTQKTIRDFYRHATSLDPLPESETVDWINLSYATSDNLYVSEPYYDRRFGDGYNSSFLEIKPSTELKGLHQIFSGFQFKGGGQLQDSNEGGSGEEEWYSAEFHLNQSVLPADVTSGVIPYNSTLWFNNKAIMFEAPFLNISTDCEPYSELGECVCYQNVPLSKDWIKDHDKVCMSETSGYVWGFSSPMLCIAFGLETILVVGCFGMWLDYRINSRLVRAKRPGTGVVRNIIDLAGAVHKELGTKLGAYTNSELEKALNKCPSVGYDVVETDGLGRIELVSVPEGPRKRRHKLGKLDLEKKYG